MCCKTIFPRNVCINKIIIKIHAYLDGRKFVLGETPKEGIIGNYWLLRKEELSSSNNT